MPAPGQIRVSGTRRKALTDSDRAEWAAYAQRVVPLPGRAVPPPPDTPTLPDPIRHPAHPPQPRPAPHRPAGLSVGNQPGGLDNSSWNRFRSGKLVPVRTLDLHGRTAQRAFHSLHQFLHAAHADHVRCVEVITGRGAGEAGGVLRREFPMWLNLPDIRPLILAAAHPNAANPGSVRLLLRRIR